MAMFIISVASADQYLTLNQLITNVNNMHQGQILTKGTDKIKVLGVCGEVVLTSEYNNFEKAAMHPYTESELLADGWTPEAY